MRQSCVALLLFLLCINDAFAARPLADFATGFVLVLEDKAPLYRVRLNDAVYAASVHPDHRDIAVFNSAGKAVPHQLLTPQRSASSNIDSWLSVPLFPLSSDERSFERHIEIQNDGRLIRIEQQSTLHPELSTYIIDASQIHGRVVEIKLAMIDQPSDFVTAVSIDGAKTFGRWTARVQNFPIAALRFAGRSLVQSTIKLPRNDDRYFRIQSVNKQLQLSAVMVRTQATNVEHYEVAQLTVPDSAAMREPEAIAFDLGGHFPIESIAVKFAANKLLEANLESRASASDPWRRRDHQVYYALEHDGLLLRPSARRFSGVSDRHWRLSGLAEDDSKNLRVELDVVWLAHELLFLAEGTAPFTLAVGSAAQIEKMASRNARLASIAGADLSGRASIGQGVDLGGNTALKTTIHIPWKKLVLWSVLVLAVLALGIMVVRLSRQMRA